MKRWTDPAERVGEFADALNTIVCVVESAVVDLINRAHQRRDFDSENL